MEFKTENESKRGGGIRSLSSGLVLATALFAGQAAQAALVHTDYYDAGGIKLGGWGTSSESWTFDILADGYNPATENVVSADIELNLRDDTGSSYSMQHHMDGAEYAQLQAGGDIIANWEVDTGSISFAVTSLFSLNTYGTLDVTLSATSGDFYFDDATLTANTTVVPVPAALWLFGAGLLALAGTARKK